MTAARSSKTILSPRIVSLRNRGRASVPWASVWRGNIWIWNGGITIAQGISDSRRCDCFNVSDAPSTVYFSVFILVFDQLIGRKVDILKSLTISKCNACPLPSTSSIFQPLPSAQPGIIEQMIMMVVQRSQSIRFRNLDAMAAFPLSARTASRRIVRRT